MQTKIRTARLIPIVAAALVAGAVLASVMTAPAQHPTVTPIAASAATVGTPTGELQQGVPVYRLPTIAVTASRSEELAKMAREEALARN